MCTQHMSKKTNRGHMNTLKSLVLAAALVPALASASPVLKWAFEDANSNGIFNYSETHTTDGLSYYTDLSQWNDLTYSTAEKYEGNSSIRLHAVVANGVRGQESSATASITTGVTGEGHEPQSFGERDTGKNIRGYTALSFYAKATGAVYAEIYLKDTQGNKLFLDWFGSTVNDVWQKFDLDLTRFASPDFDKENVVAIEIKTTGETPRGEFDLYLDNVQFEEASSVVEPLMWASEDANGNGEFNYSLTSASGSSYFTELNQWGDLTYSITEKYEGNSSIKMHALHRTGSTGSGYASALITSKGDGTGFEPTSVAERDQGKDISAYNTLSYYVKSETDSYVNVFLKDVNGSFAYLPDMRMAAGDWQRVSIDLSRLAGQTWIDITQIHSIEFHIGAESPTGESIFYLDNMQFEYIPQGAVPFKWAFEDGNSDGDVNYTGTQVYSGDVIFKSLNQWGDLTYTSVDPYAGRSAIIINTTNPTGSGSSDSYAAITTSSNGTGVEPTGFADKYAGKDLSMYNTMTYYAKAEVGTTTFPGFAVQSTDGDYAYLTHAPIVLTQEWQKFTVDISNLNSNPYFNLKSIHTLRVHVLDYIQGEQKFYLDNIQFENVSNP